MLITLYKSALCPRCHATRKHILELTAEDPEIQLTEIDILTAPIKSWNDGIRMIPAVKIENNIFSALFLNRNALAEFITSHTL